MLNRKLEVIEFKKPNDIHLPHKYNPPTIKKKFVIREDCTIINSLNPTQLFVYGRPVILKLF